MWKGRDMTRGASVFLVGCEKWPSHSAGLGVSAKKERQTSKQQQR